MTMKVGSGESGSNVGFAIAFVALKARRIRDVLLRDMNVSLEMHWTSRRAGNYAASAIKTMEWSNGCYNLATTYLRQQHEPRRLI